MRPRLRFRRPAAGDARRGDQREARRFSSRGNTRWIVLRGPWGRTIDRLIVATTGFSVITWQYARAGGNPYQPTLLLTTVGRRSGRRRTRALPYHRDGDRLVVVGSNGGGPRDPDWVWNVRANPTAFVRRRWRRTVVSAHVATGAERERLYRQIASARDTLDRYQHRAAAYGREIPLVVLEPVGTSS